MANSIANASLPLAAAFLQSEVLAHSRDRLASARSESDNSRVSIVSLLDVYHSFVSLSRSAFPITDTELKLIAALAMMGLRSSLKTGYSAPAAIGTPMAL